MINNVKNKRINNSLRKLYEEKTEEYLKIWQKYYIFKTPERINEFGIIDTNSYDAENGVLFVAKETNGWDYSDGITFRHWVEVMAKNNKVTGDIASKHPQIWYNLGRWAKFIFDPKLDKFCLSQEKNVSSLKNIAITNLNKAEGGSVSGKAFRKIIKEDIVTDILNAEIIKLKPKLIVLCGIKKKHIPNIVEKIDNAITIIEMPHPSARNISKIEMLEQLERGLKKED